MQTNSLTFEKISRYDRVEPVGFAIPFAQGELQSPEAFHLMDGKIPIPCQTRATAYWKDQSVKWLYVDAVVSLPGNQSKTFHFEINPNRPPLLPDIQVAVNQNKDKSLTIQTGVIEVILPECGILPCSIQLMEPEFTITDGFTGFSWLWDGEPCSTKDIPIQFEIEQHGPLAVVIRVKERISAQLSAPFSSEARYTFWAGCPFYMMDYTLTNLSQNFGSYNLLEQWKMDVAFKEEATHGRIARGDYGDKTKEGDPKTSTLAYGIDTAYIKECPIEHQMDSYSHNFWMDWENQHGGLQISLKHAAQNFPKEMRITPQQLELGLYPTSERNPLEWYAGTAKTHTLLFHIHPPNISTDLLSARSLQFNIPDIPILPSERYARSGVWLEPIFSGQVSRKIVTTFASIADNRPSGLGIFHFGDEYNLGYTYQGRGEAGTTIGDKLVWLNNEYDVSHNLFKFYARSGLRRMLDYAMVSSLHWADVDINHSASDPSLKGGHIAHCRRHAAEMTIHPSHQWVQGLFDAYHYTGNPRFYEMAQGVADNIAYQIEYMGFLTPGSGNTRSMGWALRSMLAAWRETYNERYYSLAEKIVALFNEWGKGTGELLAPYTSHSQVRVPFMNALTAVSLAQWYLETGNKTARDISVFVATDLMEYATDSWGLPFYKELPSLKRVLPVGIILELYAYAYHFTKDRRFLEAGLPILEQNVSMDIYHLGAGIKNEAPNGMYLETYLEPHGGKHFANSMTGVFLFVALAESEKLIASLDHSLRL
jgi:hypothetical protein